MRDRPRLHRVRSRWTVVPILMLAACSRVTPPPPPSTGWSHQPAGFTAWTDWPLDALTGSGWGINNASGLATIVADAAAPVSPPGVGQWRYPPGFPGGQAPATMYRALPAAFTEGYVGVWWKPSDPWQGHPSQVNKIYFLLGGACGNLIPVMYGPPGGPYHLRVAPEWGSDWRWLTPNVSTRAIALGAWHQLELYLKYNTPGQADGIVRWWMDGIAIGDHPRVSFPARGCFTEFQISPTWGGVGGAKTQADHFWFDHVYISQPGALGKASPGRILVQEGFEDARLASRGWYDNPTPLLSTTEHAANSARAIEYQFPSGATRPTAGSALRRKFPPTDAVYLSYRVKYSANWVGSQKPYHPHEFHFLTNADDDWAGLSFSHLTVYIEQNGGTPVVAIQDGRNIEQGKIGVDLTGVTERRAAAGCNGSSDRYPDHCYVAGMAYVNEKKWQASAPYFTDTPGPTYKSDWHFVEAYIKLNSIAGGKGVNDGVVQYWFDGRLVIDRRDVLLRTGAHPTMQFNQLVIAPYIGDGSPVAQAMWIDDVTVATARLAGRR